MRSSTFLIDVGIKVSFSDILALIGLYIISLLSLVKKQSSKIIYQVYRVRDIFLLFIILALYEFLSVIFIDKGNLENITLGIAIIRNFPIILVTIILIQYVDLKKIIILTTVGFFNSIIAIYYYAINLSNITYIISNKYLWEPGIYYTLDHGILRLQGLSDDPNFFFIANFISMISNIALIFSKNLENTSKKFVWIITFIVIMSANILTYSRAGFLILVIFFIMFLINYPRYAKYTFIFISLLLYPTYKIFIFRFKKGIETGGSGRIKLWEIAIEGFSESPLFGKGGRYVLKYAGNYAHNDLLELLSSHGLLYVAIMLFLYKILILKINWYETQ